MSELLRAFYCAWIDGDQTIDDLCKSNKLERQDCIALIEFGRRYYEHHKLTREKLT